MRSIQSIIKISILTGILSLSSCGSDDGAIISINEPTTYVFEREGSSTVSFSGQTTRIAMATEILSAFSDNTLDQAAIDGMFAHVEGAEDFSETSLNSSDKSVRSKVAASTDYYSANTVESNAIKSDFDALIAEQTASVFPNWETDAMAGVAGNIQVEGGGRIRYVNAKGLELNQVFAKSLIGALMTDQMLNNYLSESVLDEGANREDNDAGVLLEGKSYTNMEHKWDEAYGYLYGASADPTNPNLTIGVDDRFLNDYVGVVNSDENFAGIADDIFNAFKLGRAAIVAGDYAVRDAQAAIIREKISSVIAIRAVYYLMSGSAGLSESTPDMASVFHSLSEAYGFVYSLQFTRNPQTDAPYFTKVEVESMIDDMMGDGDNGLWDATPEALEAIATKIVAELSFTLEQAGS
jgi:hypothetical protein